MFGLFRVRSKGAHGRERRREARVPVRVAATIVLSSNRSVPCQTVDVSTSGARLDLPRDRILPSEFEVVIPARKIRRRAKLVWRAEDTLGIQFV